MTSEYTRLRDGHGSDTEAESCLRTCRTWSSQKSSSCVTLLAVLGCLTVLGILLAIAVLERPAEPKDSATLPGEPGGSVDEQWR